jgi:hypothetical protein
MPPTVPSTPQTQASSDPRLVKAGDLSRIIVETVARAGEQGIPLDELRRAVAKELHDPLPPSFQEQLDVLLTNMYVSRDEELNSYRLTEAGQWLVQGIEVVQG